MTTDPRNLARCSPFGETIDPLGGDPNEPDPDVDPAGNNRYHGHCGTCNGGQLYVQHGDKTEWETCFACAGSGDAKDEQLCKQCKGNGQDCAACDGTGYAVPCPYDPPEAYYWTDPWTVKSS